ncbi:MAG: twin-arginine translocase subunit TatC [Pseudomonadota bacterium]
MSTPESNSKELPLIAHLIELRDRILRCAAAVLLVFIALVYFANDIYSFASEPLTSQLREGESIISTKVMDTFMAPLKLTFMLAVFITIPYLLHQAWAFISPGLYQNEVRVTLPILVSSVLLFYFGIAFCYYVVLNYLFDFFLQAAPEGVKNMTDISAYLDTVMKLFLSFGLTFEIPVATVLLIMSGVTTPNDLKKHRPYVIIGCFVIGMFITPPDPFSQSMVAIPMYLLFELGLLAGRMVHREEKPDETTEDSATEKKQA